ncbi:hypothetical protein CRUP_004014, partial [Coryphaenoides rupestris]
VLSIPFLSQGVSATRVLKATSRGGASKCSSSDYDYDLCARAMRGGATTTRHTRSHPIAVILTRVGLRLVIMEGHISWSRPQSVPPVRYCGQILSQFVQRCGAETPTM